MKTHSSIHFSSFNIGRALNGIFLGSVLLATSASPTQALVTTFYDDFSGPALNPVWQASLPNAQYAGLLGFPADYQGASTYGFQSLGGASVLRMGDTMSPVQRRGFGSSTVFSPGAFRYEARFNTLVQSPSTGIDALLELWVIDASDSSRYDILSPWGGDLSSNRAFLAGSSIDGNFTYTSLAYQDNTWYRMVIDAQPGQNIRLSILNDGGTELAGLTLGHTAAAYADGFRIAISQSIGIPYNPSPTDVALDFVQVSQVPEPTVLVVGGCGLALLLARRRNSAI